MLTARIGGSQAVEAQPAVLRKLLSVCHSTPCWTASRSQGIVNGLAVRLGVFFLNTPMRIGGRLIHTIMVLQVLQRRYATCQRTTRQINSFSAREKLSVFLEWTLNLSVQFSQ